MFGHVINKTSKINVDDMTSYNIDHVINAYDKMTQISWSSDSRDEYGRYDVRD